LPSTTYSLAFLPSALKEWRKLGAPVREQFKRKLAERMEQPRVPSAALSGLPDYYKIKLRAAGYRLVYRVEDAQIMIVVVAVGKRERNAVYKAAAGRNRP
jgi:mRNA interferase RelE/StbE